MYIGNSPLKRLLLRYGFIFVTILVLCPPIFASETSEPVNDISLGWIIPFVLLLLSIAIVPLIANRFWERWYWVLSLGLGLVTAAHFIWGTEEIERILAAGREYISFICMIGSLYVVSGGILIHLWVEGSALTNVLFLVVGAVVSNIFGTTGASVLLIRPYIRINRGRMRPYHIVFFIFLVSNMGGLYTPIGDPPLFLGFLRGVPFFWLPEHVFGIWLLTIGSILGIFYIVDRKSAPQGSSVAPPSGHRRFELIGITNLIFLGCITLSIIFHHSLNRIVPFLPEAIQVGAAAVSYFTTSKQIHLHNEFTFGPIREVALIFAGIFATMIPALQYLEGHAAHLGISTPGMFFWYSGLLSSVLDNAPTYLAFLTTVTGMHNMSVADLLMRESTYRFIIAISVGSVFFGANTYIGNGPNFMVKTIAEELGCSTPSFLGYVFKYSIPVLLPIFVVVWLIWFR